MADHHLQIKVHSEGVSGRGTQFFIDFPRYVSEKMRPNEPEAKKSDAPTGWTLMSWLWPWASKKTLAVCVDDNNVCGDSSAVAMPLEVEESPLTEDPAPTLLQKEARHTLRTNHQPASRLSSTGVLDGNKSIGELSILIVDDSSLNRKMMTRTLKQHHIGASYEGVGDGLELLSVLGVPGATETSNELDFVDLESNFELLEPSCSLQNQRKYDVILLDDHMVRMDGSAAMKILRRCGYKGLVVGVTGSALEEDLNAFCAAGVDYALPKPFVLGDFVDIVNTHIAMHDRK